MPHTPDEYPPEQCQHCGLPFNNGDPTPSGLCAECDANAHNI
jgi:hypothetical protein